MCRRDSASIVRNAEEHMILLRLVLIKNPGFFPSVQCPFVLAVNANRFDIPTSLQYFV